MAARIRAEHQADIVSKIQASQLVNMLEKHALKRGGRPIDQSRIKAAEILLARVVPTLTAVEQSTPDPFAGTSREDIVARLRLLLQDPSIARELGIPVQQPTVISNDGVIDGIKQSA